MKLGLILFRFGILGLLFAPGVLLEDPIKSVLVQHHDQWTTYLLLYGLPVLVGFTLIAWNEEGFRNPLPLLTRLVNALSLLTVFWLLLWCLLWPGLAMSAANPNDPFVQHIFALGLLGAAIGLGCYFWAWRNADLSKRSCWFIVAIGWNITCMAFLNLHLNPAMGHLKGPGIGGLLLMAGIAMILQEL